MTRKSIPLRRAADAPVVVDALVAFVRERGMPCIIRPGHLVQHYIDAQLRFTPQRLGNCIHIALDTMRRLGYVIDYREEEGSKLIVITAYHARR